MLGGFNFQIHKIALLRTLNNDLFNHIYLFKSPTFVHYHIIA